MTDRALRLLLAAAIPATLLAACAVAVRPGTDAPTLRAFGSDEELLQYQRRLARQFEKDPPPPPPPAAPPSAQAPMAGAPMQLEQTVATPDGITNVQHQGVDEGGIVKVHGDHLVILRRGRLFTVRVGDAALRAVSAVDAFGPGIDPSGAWYDELLVADDLVAVIGYSYRRGGTEVGLFRIDRDGGLEHRATYQLRSSDYYSSRNFASRLVGGKLVFYAPIGFDPWDPDPTASFPAVRRWGGQDTAFHRTAAATRVYRPAVPLSVADAPTLHTVTVCDPDDERLRCTSTAFFGPDGEVFYVSPTAVYIWAVQYGREGAERSFVYRMPLDGGAPTALRADGAPIDQLSFLESADGHLNVLVLSGAGGTSMWRSEAASGDAALLRVPLAAFGDGSRAADATRYRPLPGVGHGAVQNRFIGDWLLYGRGSGWGRSADGGSTTYAVRWAGGALDSIALPHGVDRIEAMGSGAVLVGGAGRDLHFSGVRLGERARFAERYVRTDAAQGETRTHGFFYRPDGTERGVLGLPIRAGGRAGYEQLVHGSAAVMFLRNDRFRLTEIGALSAAPSDAIDDRCRASCVDWYGNARPIFLHGRILALMGYEIVEGREEDGVIREIGRVDFAPGRPR